GRIAGLVADARELERVARRLHARAQVGFRVAGLLEVDERVGDFAERALDRFLPRGDALLVARRRLVLDRRAPPGVEERPGDADAEAPHAARGDVLHGGAL